MTDSPALFETPAFAPRGAVKPPKYWPANPPPDCRPRTA